MKPETRRLSLTYYTDRLYSVLYPICVALTKLEVKEMAEQLANKLLDDHESAERTSSQL